jgi:pyridoxine/pyridoxamine 5'-phosphate oxidase
MDLLALAKAELVRSNADQRHPFRFFYLSTQGKYPEVRMVVKRDFSHLDWSLLFFTDERSPKVAQIKERALVSALFYHPKKHLQLRMKGAAELIGPEHEAYTQYVEKVRESPAIKDYTSAEAPGTVIMKESQLQHGQDLHFMAIRIRPVYLDLLQLGKEEHLRMSYRQVAGAWQVHRLVP